MKRLFANLLFCLLALLTGISCKKDTKPPAPVPEPVATRNIRYILYTIKDFSGDNNLITFELVMKNGHTVLFDSAFAAMKISEIPFKTNPIVINKSVPAGNENADIVVGFLYSIAGVGNSWHLDTCSVGNPMKTVEYGFE